MLLGPDHYLVGRAITLALRRAVEDDRRRAASRLTSGPTPATTSRASTRFTCIPLSRLALRRNTRFTMPLVVRWQTPRAARGVARSSSTSSARRTGGRERRLSHYQTEPLGDVSTTRAHSPPCSQRFDLTRPALPARSTRRRVVRSRSRFAQLRGAETGRRAGCTPTHQRRRTPFVHDSTSHQYFTLRPGPVQPSSSVSVASAVTFRRQRLDAVERWT